MILGQSDFSFITAFKMPPLYGFSVQKTSPTSLAPSVLRMTFNWIITNMGIRWSTSTKKFTTPVIKLLLIFTT